MLTRLNKFRENINFPGFLEINWGTYRQSNAKTDSNMDKYFTEF